MAVIGRWPRAVFYDSKGTLFDWPATWKLAATEIVEKYDAPISADELIRSWIGFFEGFHRRAASHRYTPVSQLIEEALMTVYKVHQIPGVPEDVNLMLDRQDQVQLFSETEAALQEQQDMGLKILIYSDVETKYLDMYVSKFKTFKPDFVGTTEQAGFHKPNPRTYSWALRQVNLEARDVLYCAGPAFDCQGAMACGLITAWLRRPGGIFSKVRDETVAVGDIPADFEVENLHDVTQILRANLTG